MMEAQADRMMQLIGQLKQDDQLSCVNETVEISNAFAAFLETYGVAIGSHWLDTMQISLIEAFKEAQEKSDNVNLN